MLEGTVKVINPLGLHARAAAQLVQLAGSFNSGVILTRVDNSTTVDAKSILNVLALAASMNTTLRLNVKGEDETQAFEAICGLFTNGFGEI